MWECAVPVGAAERSSCLSYQGLPRGGTCAQMSAAYPHSSPRYFCSLDAVRTFGSHVDAFDGAIERSARRFSRISAIPGHMNQSLVALAEDQASLSMAHS